MSNYTNVSGSNGSVLSAVTGCTSCRRRTRYIVPDDSANFMSLQPAASSWRPCGCNGSWGCSGGCSGSCNGSCSGNCGYGCGCNNACGGSGSCIQPRNVPDEGDTFTVKFTNEGSRAGRAVLHAPGVSMPGPSRMAHGRSWSGRYVMD